MKYPTLFSLLLTSALACGDDSAGAKSVFVPSDAAMDLQADAGTDQAKDTLACDASDKVCPLTCEVLADPRFCWNVARAEANACAASSNVGTMSADGLSCTSSDTVVSFNTPVLTDEVSGRETWEFEVTRGATTCLALDDGPLSLALETSSGRVSIDVSPQSESYRVECPDGSAWEASGGMELLACEDADGLTSLPGKTTAKIGDEFQFALLPGSENLIWCRF